MPKNSSPSSKTPSNKTEWRQWAKEQRGNLPTEYLSQQICKRLTEWSLFQTAKHILTYRAFSSEFDLSALEIILGSRQNFYITRTWQKSKYLTVHSVNCTLEKHSFGYWQPRANVPKIDPQIIDLALIPGLCFDQQGTRLGYGTGLYDRFLLELRRDTLLVGVTANTLLVSNLPKSDFDIPMTHCANELLVKPF